MGRLEGAEGHGGCIGEGWETSVPEGEVLSDVRNHTAPELASLRPFSRSGLAPQIPEDLYHLIKKAVTVRKHLERNRHDKGASSRPLLFSPS